MNEQTIDNAVPFLTFAEKSDLPEPRLAIDLGRFIENGVGLVAYAMTRSGKSHRLRGICEETFGRVQHVVVDSEGEFSTLRPRFDYLLAATGETPGDVPLTRDNAADLCRVVMEKGVSVILDISDANEETRGDIAAAFLTQLLETPREHRRPCFVVVDEVHRFAPEGGVKSASSKALAEICARGAKRGLIPIFATQNIAKTSKRAVEELPNKLVGRLTLDTHVDRAVDDLGLRRADAQNLKNLPRGHFYAVGPSLCDLVTEVRTGPNATAPPPRFAKGNTEPPPASEAIKALIAALSQLPQMDAPDVQNLEVARAKIADLTRRLENAPKPKPVEIEVKVPVLDESMERRLIELVDSMVGVGKDLVNTGGEIVAVIRKVRPASVLPAVAARPVAPVAVAPDSVPVAKPIPAAPKAKPASRGLPPAQQAFLNTLADFERLGVFGLDAKTLTVYSGYSATSSMSGNTIRALKELRLIVAIGSEIRLTGEGRTAAKASAKPLSLSEFHAAWLSKLPAGPAKMLRILLDEQRQSGKKTLARKTLIGRSGHSLTSSSPSNFIRALALFGIVEAKNDAVSLTPLLFPKGLKQ